MTNAFIFHGTDGYPEENWFPWLKGKLEALGYNVIVPQFPIPEDQSFENWFSVFEKYKDFYNSDTLLIGHSIGGTFLLKVLERYEVIIKAAYCVSAPIGVVPVKNYKGDQPFIGHPFEWAKIRRHAKKFFVFHSDNDPYVCLGNGEELAKHLGTDLTLVANAGHFNKAAGYLQFELLYDMIREDA
ncbi:alpha/beta hydrolase [Patescibacteria group bacterium]|nr:alpha/beta hydrolase [Patescibacteria group bacterium]